MTEHLGHTGPLLRVTGLEKRFPIRSGVFSRARNWVRAVNGIDFTLERGKTLALVGESGCGKTTTGRLVARLLEPTAGSIEFGGVDIAPLPERWLRPARRRVQMVFQDPFGSLNPRLTVGGMLDEILRVHFPGLSRNERRDRIADLLIRTGLDAEAMFRYPHEFSGGQRQRIAIARALATEPELVIADEPVSALDVSVQAQVLNLLVELQETLGIALLFISHDLHVVRRIAHEVAVMYLGRIVERAPADELYANPVHPYTQLLLAAAPFLDPSRRHRYALLQGEPPSPVNLPSGCPFHPRCPDARPECREAIPRMETVRIGHQAACFVHAPASSKVVPPPGDWSNDNDPRGE